MVIHSNFPDFVLFLYVHMAFADESMHGSEEEVILTKMTKLFPGETDLKAKFEEAAAAYKKLDRQTVMTIIKETFKHFDQVKFAQKYKIYTDMYDIVNADGKIEESEKHALENLKAIIDLNAESKKA
ncbi:MAG: TerB family tellurite resistance protein [Cyclobacteriaceae bacterium]|nr:TerB family tellurite resistance protein [Cyclobacteriaceae bacterium]